VKLLLVHPFIAFKLINLNNADNVDNGVFASLDILLYPYTYAKDSAPTSQIMSSNQSSCIASYMMD